MDHCFLLEEGAMQDMRDIQDNEADRADADRIHEGYQHRYEKERRASYMVALFGILAIAAVVVVMFMHRYIGNGASNLANVEPAAGSSDMNVTTPMMPVTPQ
jgi:hypothetical protein